MSETKNLFAALAAVQAELPKIDKSNVGDIPGKDGKRGYKYKYADLADVSQAILPLLAKHGLAFNSKPTMADGEFGLLYKLVHESGEMDEGFYPFGRGGSPQQVGSLITYARRYCLCAITGAAPDEDDDASAAEQPYRQSAGDVFEQAEPARPQQPRQRPQAVRPTAAEQVTPATGGGEPDPDAQVYADEAHEARTIRDLEGIHERARKAGKIGAVIRNPATGKSGQLALYVNWRRQQVKETDEAWNALNDTAGHHRTTVAELEIQFKTKTGADLEAASAAQIREFIAGMDGAAA
jgi:hypothetical protein